MKSVLIIGTGLIGASVGLALRNAGFTGSITGIDASGDELKAAEASGAIDRAARSPEDHRAAIAAADVIVLAVPVMAILQWMQSIAPQLRPGHRVLHRLDAAQTGTIPAPQRPRHGQRPRLLRWHRASPRR